MLLFVECTVASRVFRCFVAVCGVELEEYKDQNENGNIERQKKTTFLNVYAL